MNDFEKFDNIENYFRYAIRTSIEYTSNQFNREPYDLYLYLSGLLNHSQTQTIDQKAYSALMVDLHDLKKTFNNDDLKTKMLEYKKALEIGKDVSINKSFKSIDTTLMCLNSDEVLLNTLLRSAKSITATESINNKEISKKIGYWNSFAKIYNVDIDDELTQINQTFKEIEGFDKNRELFKSIESIHKNYGLLKDSLLRLKNLNTNNKKGLIFEINKFLTINNNIEDIMNNDSISFNNPLLNKTFNEAMTNFKMYEHYNELNNQFMSIYEKTLNSHEYVPLNMAEKYYFLSLKDKKVLANFVEFRDADETINFSFEVENNKKYNALTFFHDGSVVIRDKNNNIKVSNSTLQTNNTASEMYESYIDNKLNKNPHIAKVIKNRMKKNPKSMKDCVSMMNTYIGNESILKANSFDIMKEFKNFRTFESLDDKMNANILDHKIKQYAHSIVSNKYRHLYDEYSYALFKEIYSMKVEAKVVQDLIGKKLASFKDCNEFNKALNKLYNSFNDFNLDAVSAKATRIGVKIELSENNILVVKIKDFEQSKALGSPSWCISRQKQYFNSYTKDDANQYFIFDFNKDAKDNSSMIGLTLTNDGAIHASHLKNDSRAERNELLNDIQFKIVKQNRDVYINITQSLALKIIAESSGIELNDANSKSSSTVNDFRGLPRLTI